MSIIPIPVDPLERLHELKTRLRHLPDYSVSTLTKSGEWAHSGSLGRRENSFDFHETDFRLWNHHFSELAELVRGVIAIGDGLVGVTESELRLLHELVVRLDDLDNPVEVKSLHDCRISCLTTLERVENAIRDRNESNYGSITVKKYGWTSDAENINACVVEMGNLVVKKYESNPDKCKIKFMELAREIANRPGRPLEAMSAGHIYNNYKTARNNGTFVEPPINDKVKNHE